MSNYTDPKNPYSQPTPTSKHAWQLSPTASILVLTYLSLGIVLAFLAGLAIGREWGRRKQGSGTKVEDGHHEMQNPNGPTSSIRRESGDGQEGQNRGQNRGGDQVRSCNHTQFSGITTAEGPNDTPADQITTSNQNMPTNANSTANRGPNSTGEHKNPSPAPLQIARQAAPIGRRGNNANAGRDLTIDTVLQADAEDRRQRGLTHLPGTAL